MRSKTLDCFSRVTKPFPPPFPPPPLPLPPPSSMPCPSVGFWTRLSGDEGTVTGLCKCVGFGGTDGRNFMSVTFFDFLSFFLFKKFLTMPMQVTIYRGQYSLSHATVETHLSWMVLSKGNHNKRLKWRHKSGFRNLNLYFNRDNGALALILSVQNN